MIYWIVEGVENNSILKFATDFTTYVTYITQLANWIKLCDNFVFLLFEAFVWKMALIDIAFRYARRSNGDGIMSSVASNEIKYFLKLFHDVQQFFFFNAFSFLSTSQFLFGKWNKSRTFVQCRIPKKWTKIIWTPYFLLFSCLIFLHIRKLYKLFHLLRTRTMLLESWTIRNKIIFKSLKQDKFFIQLATTEQCDG